MCPKTQDKYTCLSESHSRLQRSTSRLDQTHIDKSPMVYGISDSVPHTGTEENITDMTSKEKGHGEVIKARREPVSYSRMR